MIGGWNNGKHATFASDFRGTNKAVHSKTYSGGIEKISTNDLYNDYWCIIDTVNSGHHRFRIGHGSMPGEKTLYTFTEKDDRAKGYKLTRFFVKSYQNKARYKDFVIKP